MVRRSWEFLDPWLTVSRKDDLRKGVSQMGHRAVRATRAPAPGRERTQPARAARPGDVTRGLRKHSATFSDSLKLKF